MKCMKKDCGLIPLLNNLFSQIKNLLKKTSPEYSDIIVFGKISFVAFTT